MENLSQAGKDVPKSFDSLSKQNLNFDNVDDLMLVHGRHHELSDEQRSQHKAKEDTYYARTMLSSDPHDPSFYHVYNNTLPDEQYYRLIPEGKYQSIWGGQILSKISLTHANFCFCSNRERLVCGEH